MYTKFCKKCQQEKPLEQFHKASIHKGKQYYYPYCKECSSKISKEYARLRETIIKPIIDQKVCLKCKLMLPIDNFRQRKSTKDGYREQCKKCEKEYERARHKMIEKIEKPSIDGKVCQRCRIYKPSEDFCKCKQHRDGLNKICRECVRITRNRLLKRIKERERLQTDPVFRLCYNLRNRMRFSIKTQSKSAKSLELLGCTGAECMEHLERLFWPGMTRENYGRNGWVIDHITPIASFDKTDPNWQFKAFHYTNLQPLWWWDNKTKDDRLDWTPTESKYELPERLKVQLASEPSQPLPRPDTQKEQSKS